MKHKLLDIPIWDYPILLIRGGDCSDIMKLANKYKLSKKVKADIAFDNIQKDDRGAAYWCSKTGMGVMWFNKKKIVAGTIGHEIIHILDYLSVHIGMETEMEARAYTYEYLMELIPKHLKSLK